MANFPKFLGFDPTTLSPEQLASTYKRLQQQVAENEASKKSQPKGSGLGVGNIGYQPPHQLKIGAEVAPKIFGDSFLDLSYEQQVSKLSNLVVNLERDNAKKGPFNFLTDPKFAIPAILSAGAGLALSGGGAAASGAASAAQGGLLGIEALGPASALPSFNTLLSPAALGITSTALPIAAAGTASAAGAGGKFFTALQSAQPFVSAGSTLLNAATGKPNPRSTLPDTGASFSPKVSALLSRRSPEVLASVKHAVDEERRRRGRSSTILTSGRGVTEPLGSVSRPAGRQAELLG